MTAHSTPHRPEGSLPSEAYPPEVRPQTDEEAAREDEERKSSDWYVSGAHTRRAIGYLSVALVERGYLPDDFELPLLLDLWGEALERTIEMTDLPPSPISAA